MSIKSPAKFLCAHFAKSNILTSPTIGPDRHTAFIELDKNVVVRAESYKSEDDAAELLLEKLRKFQFILNEGFRGV